MVKKAFNGKVRVDERIEALIPPLDSEQLKGLEESLLEEGRAYSPLWLWGDLLVDGHHRFKLCKKNKLPFETIQVYQDAETLEEVEDRIKRDAISQRNLTPGAQSKLRAERVKYRMSQGENKRSAVQKVAEESEVSERQVYRDVVRAEMIEQVDNSVQAAAVDLTQPALEKLVEMPKPEQKKVGRKAKGDSKNLEKAINKPLSVEDMAKKAASIANQHRDKLVRAIDDYHELVPNSREREKLVKLVQGVELWSKK